MPSFTAGLYRQDGEGPWALKEWGAGEQQSSTETEQNHEESKEQKFGFEYQT